MHGVGDQKQRITTRIEAQPSVAQGTAGYAFPWGKKRPELDRCSFAGLARKSVIEHAPHTVSDPAAGSPCQVAK
jgi:hypothetical protein